MSLDPVAKLASGLASFNLTPNGEPKSLLESLVTCPNGSEQFLQLVKQLRLSWSEGLKIALREGCSADYIACQIKDYIRPSVLSAFIGVLEAANDDGVRVILERFNQLKQVHKTISSIDLIGLLRMAVFIETKMQPAVESGMRFFQKRETKLPRTLLVDPARAIYVLSQPLEPKMVYYYGTDEVFQKSLAIPFAKAEKVGLVAHGGTSGFMGMSPNAIEFAQMFKDKKGFAQLMYSCKDASAQVARKDKVLGGHYAIWELYSGNLMTCKVSLFNRMYKGAKDILLTVEDMLRGLSEMHSQKIIHGNINPMNVWLYNGESRQIAVLGNFGFSFYADKELPSHLKKGYGTLKCTAPELLEAQEFTFDLYKSEIFALGVTLYSWLCDCETFPWEWVLAQYMRSGCAIPQIKETYLDCVREGVERMKKSYQEDNWQNKVVRLTLQMMDPDPDKRYDAAMCLKELRAIIDS